MDHQHYSSHSLKLPHLTLERRRPIKQAKPKRSFPLSLTISNATSAPSIDAETAGAKPAVAANPPRTSGTASDTVQISTTAQAAAKAAMQEATETHAETLTEAQKGDHQAQRLLARESEAKQ
jgi:hypothetical protein